MSAAYINNSHNFIIFIAHDSNKILVKTLFFLLFINRIYFCLLYLILWHVNDDIVWLLNRLKIGTIDARPRFLYIFNIYR